MTDLIPDATLSTDTQVALLLHGRFGRSEQGEAKPLTPGEFNALGSWLVAEGLRPSELLSTDGLEHVSRLPATVLDADRVRALLARGMALAFAVEEWMRRGIWMLGRADAVYPPRLLARLRSAAPPLLYGAGDPSLLTHRAVGVVGSRDADDQALAFARSLGARSAREDLGVVSGSAQGVDIEAMMSALQEGGVSVGVLAEGVSKPAVSRRYREWLSTGRLALVSPYAPDARWAGYQAMARNKVVYGLSEHVVVVSSDARGGTWEGATESLLKGWGPVLVRIGPDVPEGNRRLAERGAAPLPSAQLTDTVSLASLLAGAAQRASRSGDLFSQPEAGPPEEGGEHPHAGDGAPHALEESAQTKLLQANAPEKNTAELPTALPAADLFGVVWPHIAQAFQNEVPAESVGEIADRLDVQRAQLTAWLSRAASEGLVQKRTRPVRYVVAS